MKIKVIISGPESTGKSTLSEQLSKVFNEPWVPEYARDYIEQLDRPYQESDLLKIAKGQVDREDAYAHQARQIYFCDTSLEVVKVWSEYKFNRCNPWIIEQMHNRKVDLYLLCAHDLPWSYDPLRENPDSRDELFEIYQQELSYARVEEIWGKEEERLERAVEIIRTLLP